MALTMVGKMEVQYLLNRGRTWGRISLKICLRQREVKLDIQNDRFLIHHSILDMGSSVCFDIQ